MVLRTAAPIPVLLAAYRAEEHDSVWSLTVAQNIVERLIADRVFEQLADLRDRLEAGMAHPFTAGPLNRAALDTLTNILTAPED